MHLYPYVYGWNRQNLYAILLLREKIAMYASEKNTSWMLTTSILNIYS